VLCEYSKPIKLFKIFEYLFRHHRLRGSVSTVVTMTSKVNEKTEILTPCRSEIPENIEAKLGVIDYVMDPYNRAKFCGNRSKGVCSSYCWNI